MFEAILTAGNQMKLNNLNVKLNSPLDFKRTYVLISIDMIEIWERTSLPATRRCRR